MSDKLIVK